MSATTKLDLVKSSTGKNHLAEQGNQESICRTRIGIREHQQQIETDDDPLCKRCFALSFAYGTGIPNGVTLPYDL